jgi:ketosteroid isomerase-like protein
MDRSPGRYEREHIMTATAQSSTSLGYAVDQTRKGHVAAVNAGDVEASVSQFAPDGVFLPPGAPALHGAMAMRGWFTQVFGMFRILGFNLQPGGVEQFGTIAIEHGNWSATFQPRDASPAQAGGGTYLTVYQQQPDGSARILRDTFNGLPG